MTRYADYVYRNAADTARVRVFKRENGRWDFDWAITVKQGVRSEVQQGTYSTEAGDDFARKRDALDWAIHQFGLLQPINPVGLWSKVGS